MNSQQFQTYWTHLQSKIKQKWSKFTDQDLKQINGEKEKFLSQLQQKYGINKDQAEKELVEISKTVSSNANAPKSPNNPNSKNPSNPSKPNPSNPQQPKKK